MTGEWGKDSTCFFPRGYILLTQAAQDREDMLVCLHPGLDALFHDFRGEARRAV